MKKRDILILGPRGVGKTTLLSLFYSEVQNLLDEEGIDIQTDLKTKKMLDKSSDELQRMLDSTYDVVHEIANTDKIKKYPFDLTHQDSQKKLMKFNVIDHPGGYLTNVDHFDKISALMTNSSTVVCVIDTPYFMEMDALHNEHRNGLNAFVKLFEKDGFDISKKNVIFALMKSEKYTPTAVKNIFKHTFSELLKTLEKNKVVEVLPIETVGGIVFKEFVSNHSDKTPDAVYTRKHPNSTFERKNVDTFSRMIAMDIFSELERERFLIFETKRSKIAKQAKVNLERIM